MIKLIKKKHEETILKIRILNSFFYDTSIGRVCFTAELFIPRSFNFYSSWNFITPDYPRISVEKPLG